MINKKVYIIFIILLFFYFSIEQTAIASKLNIETNELLVKNHTSEITINLAIEKDEQINALEGRLRLSNEFFELLNIKTKNSIVDFWSIAPFKTIVTDSDENKFTEIIFSGVILEKSAEDFGELLTLVVKPLKKGKTEIELVKGKAYYDEGADQNLKLPSKQSLLVISEEESAKKEEIEKEVEIKSKEKKKEIPDDKEPIILEETAEKLPELTESTPATPEPEIIREDSLTKLIEQPKEEEKIPEKIEESIEKPAVIPQEISTEAKERIEIYKKEINTVQKEKIITKDLFEHATKCEFIVMNGRAAKWTVDSAQTKSIYFDDINRENLTWCAPYADYAYVRGIIKGRSDNIFGAEGYVTRFEVAVIIARQIMEEIDKYANIKTNFNDDIDIVPWSRSAIHYLNKNKIFKGFDNLDGTFTFGGKRNIKKIDAGIVLYRTFWKGGE